MRIGSETATVTGRLAPMGKKSRYYVEYGPDANYGHKTREEYGGLQITPRSVIVSLTGLQPDSTCHCRIVGVNEDETTFGEDAVLRTKPR
jgi:hypothetical protein